MTANVQTTVCKILLVVLDRVYSTLRVERLVLNSVEFDDALKDLLNKHEAGETVPDYQPGPMTDLVCRHAGHGVTVYSFLAELRPDGLEPVRVFFTTTADPAKGDADLASGPFVILHVTPESFFAGNRLHGYTQLVHDVATRRAQAVWFGKPD